MVAADDNLHGGRRIQLGVTIIGAGNMGRGIATRAIAGGSEVEIVDRDPAKARKLAEELGGSATGLEPDASFGGEVVVRRRRPGSQAKALPAVSEGGLRPLDVGPLARAQQLEQLGFLHISLQEPHNLNFGSAIKLHP